MPYEIETKDGIVIRGIPDNIPPDHASVKAKVTNARQAAGRPTVSAEDRAMANPTGSTWQNLTAGFGKAISDTGHGINQLVTDVLPGKGMAERSARLQRESDETKQLDAPLMDTGGGMTGNIAGNLAIALAPGGALKAGGMAARAAGAGGMADALGVAGTAAMVPRTITGAGVQGAALGAVQPVGEGDSRGANMAFNAGAGAAIPGLATAAKGVKSLIDPLTDAGRSKILGRALVEASGGDANLVSKLRGAQTLVPGSLPTAGEAANNASIAALQRSAFASTPEVKNAVVARAADQNTARVGELLDLAGTGGERDMASAVRDFMSDGFFKMARKDGIDPKVAKMLQPQIDNLAARMPAGVMEKARELARIKGETMGPEGSVSGLHSIKKAVDDLIDGAAQTGMGKQTKAALVQYKQDLLQTIEELSPKYMQGSRNFRTFSGPLNEMDTVQEIAKKSVSGINDKLTPHAFARALRDESAQKATGFRGATLENTLSANSTQRLNAIKEDLRRSDFAANAGRSGSDTVEKLAYNNMLQRFGVPTLLRNLGPTQLVGNLAASGANLVYGNANKRLQRQLAEALMSPQETAALIEKATPSQRQALVAALARNVLTPAALAAPAALNAQ